MKTFHYISLLRARFLILLFPLYLVFPCEAQVYINATDNLPNDGASGQSVDVVAIDIDDDGDKDIILANEYQVNTILFNNGQGQFDYNPNTLLANLHDSEDIAVADFDGDGDLDILFVSEDDFEHEFFLNNGAGGFDLTPIEPFSASNSVVVEDFNGDDIPDLFIGNLGQNFILINDGNATFTNETASRLPAIFDTTYDVKIIDIENDGDHDIFVANSDGNKLLINVGGGYFTDETSSRLPQGLVMDTRKVIPGDVNDDGYADFLLCNVEFSVGNDPQNRLYLNDGSGVFADLTDGQLPEFNDQSMDAVFMDFDDDGDNDILLTNVLHSPLLIYKNDGVGKFSDANTIALGTQEFTLEAMGIVTEDFNGDSLIDIYICNRDGKDLLLLKDPEAVVISTQQPQIFQGNMWPNPAANRMAIEKTKDLENPSFRIVDLIGREIGRLNPVSEDERSFEFDLSNIQRTGLLFLEVRTDKAVFLKEFYKE